MKIHRLLLGIIITILLCELIVRLISFFAFRGHSRWNFTMHDKTTILCVGDSVTFGLGSPSELSYPFLLGRRLNGSGAAKYRVINMGSPGYTATELRRDLRNMLQQYNPDVIIVLMGMNDSWKIVDLPASFLPVSEGPAHERMLRIMLALSRSFSFRLFNLSFIKLKNEFDILKMRQLNKGSIFDPSLLDNKANLSKHLRVMLGNIVYNLLLDKRSVILMTYPRRGGIADKALKDTAAAYAVPLVDLAAIFKSLDDSYFINDQFHPNWKGNTIMVREIFHLIEAQQIRHAASSEQNAGQLYENQYWQPLFKENQNEEEFNLEDMIRAEKIQRPQAMIRWSPELGAKFNTTYSIWKDVILPQGEYRIKLTAMGTSLHDVFPEVVIIAAILEGLGEPCQIAKFMVERDFKTYTSLPFILKNRSQISLCIAFTNDAYEPGVGDRNLFIKRIAVERQQ